MPELPLQAASTQWVEQERARLLEALGAIPTGGVIESIEPLDQARAESASPGVDIGLSVWPYPLGPAQQAALAALGYAALDVPEDAPEQRFRHAARAVELFVFEAGTELWSDHQVVRDYLRRHPEVRPAGRRAPADGQSPFPRPLLDAARQWWVDAHGFAPVEQAAQALAGFEPAWYISSGWALDLFLGSVSRVHLDVDIVIPRAAQLDLQQFLTTRGWQLVTPLDGRGQPWPPHMRLELPRHQVHAFREGVFIDFLLSEIEPGIWRYRRVPSILRAEARMSLRSSHGLPILAPELVLLFKSQSKRPKDHADFERVYTRLEPERQAWLHWALVATAPGHPWLERLSTARLGD